MHTTPPRPPGATSDDPGPHARWMRRARALAAGTASLALLASVALMFDSASPREWPAPTQDLAESQSH